MTHETINKPTRQHGGHPVVRLIRPKQWIKNLIVLLPIFFGGALLQPEPMTSGLIPSVSPHRPSTASTTSSTWRMTAATP